jgi:capsular exopolysaccharide synthesis family protein
MSDPSAPAESSSVSLREYLAVLRLRKWSIFVITALTVGSALYFSVRQTPQYESSSRVLVKPIQSGSEFAAPTIPNLETERGLVASAPVAARVAEELDLAESPSALLAAVEVELVPSSEFLIISYRHSDPLEAQRRTRAFAQEYLDYRRDQAVDDVLAASQSVQERVGEVEEQLDALADEASSASPSEQAQIDTQENLLLSQLAVLQQQLSGLTPSNISVGQIVEPAQIPSAPVSPNFVLNLALALILGLALGVGLAFLRERLDDRLRGRQDVEMHSGAPVLAVIPEVGSWKKKKKTPVITITEPRSGASEAYRTLRTAVTFLAAQENRKVFLVTSAHPDEGKTATVANLAVSLAQAGKRVVAISADLRKPRLHRFLQSSSNGAGLTNVLAGETSVADALGRPGLETLRLLGSGPVPGNPNELLGSERMGQVIDELREIADFVLIDSAPVLAVADALTLSPFADAVLLVADAQKTTRGSLSHARQELDQVDAKVVGTILNNFDPAKAKGYPNYQYYYVYRYQEPDQPVARPRSGRRGKQGAAVDPRHGF